MGSHELGRSTTSKRGAMGESVIRTRLRRTARNENGSAVCSFSQRIADR